MANGDSLVSSGQVFEKARGSRISRGDCGDELYIDHRSKLATNR
jgi:hypothetical protein